MEDGAPTCSRCQVRLRRQRTKRRERIVTLQGEAEVRIATFACPDHPDQKWQAPYHLLLGLIGQRQITVDVLIAVGVLRYALGRRIEQVQCILDRRGIHLSTGQISALGVEFLVRWHAFFDRSRRRWAPRIRRGLILLIDGTQDAGGPVTYRAVDARHGVTLHTAHYPSENEEDLVVFLQELKRVFGKPRLIVRDGSTAAKNACTRVFPGVPQALCHWHFLRNVGNALFAAVHERLRKAILATKQLARLETCRKEAKAASTGEADSRRRSLRVAVRLQLEDVLSARDSVGGLPFRVPYHEVAVRVRAARERLKDLVVSAMEWNVCEPVLLEAKERVDALWNAPGVRDAFIGLDRRWTWFGRLRSWFRLEEAVSGRPMEPRAKDALEPAEVSARIHGMRAQAEKAGAAEAAAWMQVVSRFEENEAELFPRVRLRNPPRTTSGIEYAHRATRRQIRRRLGTLATRQEMERLGPHLAAWDNVGNAWFIRRALGGVDLAAVFMEQDAKEVAQGVAAVTATRYRDRLPVRSQDRGLLLDKFIALAKGQATPQALAAWADLVEGVPSPGV